MIFDKGFFPYLEQHPDVAYFDNASTTHIHQFVLDAMTDYYVQSGATPNRGVSPAAELAEDMVAKSANSISRLLDRPVQDILFTSGATEGLNWVAQWHSDVDVVIISESDHHSVYMPFLQQGRSTELNNLVILPCDVYGNVMFEEAIHEFNKLTEARLSALIILTDVSNITGRSITSELAIMAKNRQFTVCVDLSQSILHHAVDCCYNKADYLLFSIHKMFGPKGVGVLYAKNSHTLPAIKVGGGTAQYVDSTGYELYPDNRRHMAGTPNTAGIIGAGVCADLNDFVGYEDIYFMNTELQDSLTLHGLFDLAELNPIAGLDTANKTFSTVFTFEPTGFSSIDLTEMLYNKGVVIRAGDMCAQPFARTKSDQGLIRISIAPYNTDEDCQKLVHTIKQCIFTLT